MHSGIWAKEGCLGVTFRVSGRSWDSHCLKLGNKRPHSSSVSIYNGVYITDLQSLIGLQGFAFVRVYSSGRRAMPELCLFITLHIPRRFVCRCLQVRCLRASRPLQLRQGGGGPGFRRRRAWRRKPGPPPGPPPKGLRKPCDQPRGGLAGRLVTLRLWHWLAH